MKNSTHPGRSIIARLNDPTCKEAQFEASIEAINVLLSAIQRLESEIVKLREAVTPGQARPYLRREEATE